MKRVVLSSFIALLIIGAIAGGYFYYQKLKVPHSEALNAIPPDAAFLIRSENFKQSWDKLFKSSLWQILKENANYQKIEKDVHAIDSSFSKSESAKQFLENYPVYLSAHTINNKTEFLYVLNLPPLKQENFVNDVFEELGLESSKRNYNGQIIHELELNKKQFSYTVYKGIFVASFSSMLMEDAIRQLKVGKPFTNDPFYSQVYKASGRNVDANIFINYKQFPRFLSVFFKDQGNFPMAGLESAAQWTGLDLRIKENGLMLNGFSSVSPNSYYSIFLKQNPQIIESASVLPKKTALFHALTFNDMSSYLSGYEAYLSGNKMLQQYNSTLNSLEQKTGIKVRDNFLSWANNEIALVITEPENNNYQSEVFGIVKTKDAELAQKALKELSKAANKKEPKEENYKSYSIGLINIKGLLSSIYGGMFDHVEKSYYTIIGNFVVFGNQASAIRTFIDANKDRKLLIRDKEFVSMNENMEQKTNSLVYVNLNRSDKIVLAHLHEAYALNFSRSTENYKKLGSIAIQFRGKGDMIYNNIFWQTMAKNQSAGPDVIWEAVLDTTISSRPYIVSNHKTDTKEVIVQDDANNLYLIDSSGAVLWKVPVREPILGEIHQVDAFKNNRFQYLFNTSSKLYLIDRNGENVDDYPIEFKHKATNGIAVFDYEKKQDYRIFVAGDDNIIRAFQINGKSIEGWKFTDPIGPVSKPVQHFVVQGKDYLLINDDKGGVYITDRKGNKKVEPEKQAETRFRNQFFVKKGSSEDNIYWLSTDTTGTLYKYYLNGKVESKKLNELAPGHQMFYLDLDRDDSKEFITINQNKLEIFKEDSAAFFSYTFENEIKLPAIIFDKKDEKGRLGVVDNKAHKLYLFDSDFTLRKGFPVKGQTPFSLSETKEGQKTLTTGTEENTIVTYSLE